MGRRKEGLVGALAKLPWPVGIVVGVAAFVAVRYGLPEALKGNMFAAVLAGPIKILPWLLLGAGFIGSLLSLVGRRQRRRMLDAQSGLDSIAALDWREFEQLIGEAFRRQGYSVEETGLGGADGGIDLTLRKDGRRVLVQCKQWRRRQVPVNVVREMIGLLGHHKADAVKIVCVGHFTRDAERFAKGKPVELVGRDSVLQMIREVQASPGAARTAGAAIEPASTPIPEASPSCPNCGKSIIARTNRRSGDQFFGCSGYPVCRGTRPVIG